MTLKHSPGKGNKKEQQKRRRQRWQNRPEKQKEQVELIDGNWSFYPIGECTRYNGYLTQGLCDTHHCLERDCPRFKKIGGDTDE